MGAAFFVGTYIHEVPTRVRGVIVMDKTAFFTMPSGLYVVSAAADGLRAGCVINTAVQVTSMPPRISVAVNKDNVTSGGHRFGQSVRADRDRSDRRYALHR